MIGSFSYDIDFQRGRFRVRGDVVEVFLAYEESALRIELPDATRVDIHLEPMEPHVVIGEDVQIALDVQFIQA